MALPFEQLLAALNRLNEQTNSTKLNIEKL